MRLYRLALFFMALGLTAVSPPARAACAMEKIADLPVTMRGFRPTVTAKINGVEAPD